MKNLLFRFPHLGQRIFQKLDDQGLNKCLKLSRYCKSFIEGQKFYWIRRIVQMTNIEFSLCRLQCVILENLLLNNLSFKDLQKMDTVAKKKRQKSWHNNIFYFAFLTGQTEFLKKLFNDSSFEDYVKRVMKHIISYHAAEKGQLEIVQFIITNQNPDEINYWFCDHRYTGDTPLHIAAEKGHFDTCNFIIQKLDAKKNPKDYKNGRTPLHRAAKNGFYSICELILQNVRIKCPKDENGVTPLHLAEKYGHLEICHLFEKKPKKRKIR